MKYLKIREGIFIKRINRFIAHVEIDGQVEVCHVKNTGRCKEILIEGSKVFLEESDSPHRKTKFDLISVYKGDRLINIDSQVPNKMFKEWVLKGNLFKDLNLIKSEVFYGDSRFDFYVEYEDKKAFVEIKGVTLEENGVVLFPDAPTTRGVKHLNELIYARKNGYEAYVVFVIQMKGVKYFTPNEYTHKEFKEALLSCKNNGVNILAFDSIVSKDEIYINESVNVLV